MPMRLPMPRFALKSVLVLMLGMAIGYSLNLETWRLITGRLQSSSPPPYTIAPPDVLQIDVRGGASAHKVSSSMTLLVAPDGRVNLGEWGLVYVGGMTIEEAQAAVEKAVAKTMAAPRVLVDVYAHNSKTYYVISQPASGPTTVAEFPITGNDIVLDAIAQIGGLNLSGPLQIFVSRPAPNGIGPATMLSVDWTQLASGKSDATNYPIQPRDRITISQVPNAIASH
jgi:protein involved in polysaccharide export with SLBB domain